MDRDKVRIYTDGACSGNQNRNNTGGWGCILEYGSYRRELHGGESDTTNNRMEISAVIAALRALKREGLSIQVFTDSAYVANCFRKGWYRRWRLNGWKTTDRRDVENRGLWEELISLTERHAVSFFRVKGHVDMDSKSFDMGKIYSKFLEWNGAGFSRSDFVHITEMNNRADALANLGIEEIRAAASAAGSPDKQQSQ